MKRKMKLDPQEVKELMFPKDGSKRLGVSEAAEKLGCKEEDITRAMRKWWSKHYYDPISGKWFELNPGKRKERR